MGFADLIKCIMKSVTGFRLVMCIYATFRIFLPSITLYSCFMWFIFKVVTCYVTNQFSNQFSNHMHRILLKMLISRRNVNFRREMIRFDMFSKKNGFFPASWKFAAINCIEKCPLKKSIKVTKQSISRHINFAVAAKQTKIKYISHLFENVSTKNGIKPKLHDGLF
jgi:hypothetical protein